RHAARTRVRRVRRAGPSGERGLPDLVHGRARAAGAVGPRGAARRRARRRASLGVSTVEVNGRTYGVPQRPTAVWCLDGCDPAYLEDGFARRLLPRLSQMASAGAFGIGESQI